MNDCARTLPQIGHWLDGALEPSRLIELEEHVATCERCRERSALERATRASMKNAVAQKAPDALRARLAAAMAAEAAKSAAHKKDIAGRRPKWWLAAVPVAAAAAAILVYTERERSRWSAAIPEDVLSDFVSEHSHPLPPERTDARGVRDFEQYVGVPIRPMNVRGGAKFIGGRVLPMHKERAAMLQYEVGQGADTRRLSVMVFDPRKIQVQSSDLAPRSVGTAEVRIGRNHGYAVTVAENEGIGYVVASDMDPDRQVELVSFAANEQ